MICVEITAVFHTKVCFRQNRRTFHYLDFDPQYFPNPLEVGHLPVIFLFIWTLRIEKNHLSLMSFPGGT